MKKLSTTNSIYGFVLIALGIFGLLARYFELGDWQFTSLIPAALGVIVLALSPGIRKENKVVGHIAAVLPILIALMMAGMLFRKGPDAIEMSRKTIIFIAIIAASLITFSLYLNGFLARKRAQKAGA